MKPLDMILLAALAIMSVVAVTVTCYDKAAAKRAPRSRVPEATLMLIAALLGSFAMYATMKLIRHKTLHKKFMIGIPLLMLLHIALAVCYVLFLRPLI